ncbi:MAG: hypothetical protein ACJ8GK_10995 [Luteimonas sp.]
MKLERGTIRRIDARGRVTVELADRRIVADLHSGNGGCIGDEVEGDMSPGVRSWRNVRTSVLSVVEVVGSQGFSSSRHEPELQAEDPMPRRRAMDAPRFRRDERWPPRRDDTPGDQYSSRRFN